MAQAPLSHADQRRLKLVIDAGSSLEKIWVALPAPSDLQGTRAREHALERLVAAIHACEQGEDENLRRLSFHTRSLNLEMTSRHLQTVLVPFERLAGRALRDDEILIEEGDQLERALNTKPMRLIADNIRSAFNVGALLRTAECFGVEQVALTGYTPTPDSEKTARTSLGTEHAVDWSSNPNVHDVIDQAQADGYTVIALETAREAVDLSTYKWPKKSALLLGNERFGLDRDVLERAQVILKIPMHGTKNSLNVGIAAGISLAAWRASVDRTAADARAGHANAAKSETSAVIYEPIGTFHSNAVHKYEAPRQATESEHGGTIKLAAKFREALKDLEGFEHIWLIYDFHHNKNWKPLVTPPRGSHEKRGVFATRSPHRPNSIGLSCVELEKIEELTITVRGADLLDGSLILDIKPYLPYADSFPDSSLGWLKGIEEERFKVEFLPQAEMQLKWLDQKVPNLRPFLMDQLAFDPTDGERKRVTKFTDRFQIAYRTWRANFTTLEKRVIVSEILSGYSDEDVNSEDDRFQDKSIHRDYRLQTNKR